MSKTVLEIAIINTSDNIGLHVIMFILIKKQTCILNITLLHDIICRYHFNKISLNIFPMGLILLPVKYKKTKFVMKRLLKYNADVILYYPTGGSFVLILKVWIFNWHFDSYCKLHENMKMTVILPNACTSIA